MTAMGDIGSADTFFADRADLPEPLLRLPTLAAVEMESAAVA
jgi:nucleoside phosphorylase